MRNQGALNEKLISPQRFTRVVAVSDEAAVYRRSVNASQAGSS